MQRYEALKQSYEGNEKSFDGNKQSCDGHKQSYDGHQQSFDVDKQSYAGPEKSYDDQPAELRGPPAELRAPAEHLGPQAERTGQPAQLRRPQGELRGQPAELRGPPEALRGQRAELPQQGPLRGEGVGHSSHDEEAELRDRPAELREPPEQLQRQLAELPGTPVLRQGDPVRIIGLRGQSRHNGLEGTLGAQNADTARWAFRAGQTTLSVKAANIEPISKHPKKKLAIMFARKALDYQYHDPRLNDYVFERAYDFAASEVQPGVTQFFFDMFSREKLFDEIYDLMSKH